MKNTKRSVPYRGSSGRIAAFLVIILGWHLSATVLAKPFLPGPLPSFTRMVMRITDGRLTLHLAASGFRIGMALLVSGPVSFVLGLASGRIKAFDRIISPLVYIFHPLPKIAFLPILMLLAGLGDTTKIILICLVIAGQLYLGARDSARQCDPATVESIRSLGATGWQVFRHVLIPSSLPDLFSSLRVALGTSIAVLFFSETFASESGIGYYIMDSWARVDYPDMYAGILSLSLVSLLLYGFMDLSERFLCPWKRSP